MLSQNARLFVTVETTWEAKGQGLKYQETDRCLPRGQRLK